MSARPDLPSPPQPPAAFPCSGCNRTFTARLGYVLHVCTIGVRPIDAMVDKPAETVDVLRNLRHGIVVDVLTGDDPWREANPEIYEVIR